MKKKEIVEEELRMICARHGNTLFPGVIFGCANKERQYLFSFGTQDCNNPILPGNMFDIASVTKAFINMLTLKLIPFSDLEQPIITTLPMKGKYRDEITVKHLLMFGLEFGDAVPPLSSITEREHLVDILLNSDLYAPPGRLYRYTNITSMILTLFLEKKYGASISVLLDEYLCTPLGLNATTFFPLTSHVDLMQIVPTEQFLSRGIVQDESARLYQQPNGSAGIFSTMSDLLSFGQSIFLRKEFLSEEIVRKISLSQYGNQVACSFGLGMGLRHHNECNLLDESGIPLVVIKKNGFSGTHFCALPDNDFCFSVFANICFWGRATPSQRDMFTKFHKNILEILYSHREILLSE